MMELKIHCLVVYTGGLGRDIIPTPTPQKNKKERYIERENINYTRDRQDCWTVGYRV